MDRPCGEAKDNGRVIHSAARHSACTLSQKGGRGGEEEEEEEHSSFAFIEVAPLLLFALALSSSCIFSFSFTLVVYASCSHVDDHNLCFQVLLTCNVQVRGDGMGAGG